MIESNAMIQDEKEDSIEGEGLLPDLVSDQEGTT